MVFWDTLQKVEDCRSRTLQKTVTVIVQQLRCKVISCQYSLASFKQFIRKLLRVNIYKLLELNLETIV